MLKVAFHSDYVHPLPPGHRFPMEKYELLPAQLIREGVVEEEHFFAPGVIEEDWLTTVHCQDYLNRLKRLELSRREQRVTGFEHNSELVQRELRIMEGTRKCAELALTEGAAMNIAGGTHHAYSNRGEGFCLLNDHAVAADWLLMTENAKQILIVDLDVHQGNGTAEIFKDVSQVRTFSMHGANNYPLRKEVSDVDVPMKDGTGDEEYLNALKRTLNEEVEKHLPDFIFFQSGVDVLESDKLGRLGMTIAGCRKRDEFVVNLVRQLQVPLVCSMGGGYSPDIKTIIDAHSNTYRVVQDILF